MTISKHRNYHSPLLFKDTQLSETDSHKHLSLLFHHSLPWHTQIMHLHQTVMTKINRLRSFVNLVTRHAHLMIYKTNILPAFDYGEIIIGSLKTTSFNDVLADLNLTSLYLRR